MKSINKAIEKGFDHIVAEKSFSVASFCALANVKIIPRPRPPRQYLSFCALHANLLFSLRVTLFELVISCPLSVKFRSQVSLLRPLSRHVWYVLYSSCVCLLVYASLCSISPSNFILFIYLETTLAIT